LQACRIGKRGLIGIALVGVAAEAGAVWPVAGVGEAIVTCGTPLRHILARQKRDLGMIDDEAYINRVLDGDTAGFAPLMERYSRPVFALLVGMTGNRADAEELAQDAFLKAFRSLRSFRRDCSFATWIYRIAYNTALSALRKKRPDRPASMDDDTTIERLPDPIDDEAEETEANEERFRRLDRALEQLRADDRALVHMFYKQEKTVDELAAITGLSLSNVKVRLHRTRKKLMSLMQAMED